jgi:DNA helicase HerA-like ATPase
VAGCERIQQADRVHVLTGVGEEGAVAAVDPAAIDEQRLVAVVHSISCWPRLSSGTRSAIRSSSSRRAASRLFIVADVKEEDVFLEEAHFYASPEEILSLITRGRHLGLTTFFITNTPAQLPEVVFRQIDNLICTGLGHSGDLRTVAKSALADEDTLQSLAVGLRKPEALVVGAITGGFPVVFEVDTLPEGFPATGFTRSFWDGSRAGELREAA